MTLSNRNASEKFVLISCMRNEGVYILEWVAYHRLLGFDRIVIASNDNTDRSSALLDALADAGVIFHVNNVIRPGQSPQLEGYGKILASGTIEDGDVVASIDADEFIALRKDADIKSFYRSFGDVDGIALPWRHYGSDGRTSAGPGLVTERFRTRSSEGYAADNHFKSIFRMCGDIMRMGPHRPHYRDCSRVKFVDPAGQPVPQSVLEGKTPVQADHRLGGRGRAQLNHYATKSREEYALRAARGRGFSPVIGQHFSEESFARKDANHYRDDIAAQRAHEVRAAMETLLSLPRVREAQAEVESAHEAALLALRHSQTDPEPAPDRLARKSGDRAFIVGVGSQRAGSTLLHRILDECTDICMHPLKELHYYDSLFQVRDLMVLRRFCRDQLNREWDHIIATEDYSYIDKRFKCYARAAKMLWLRHPEDIDYIDLFRPMLAGHSRFGEVTPEYMILPDAGVAKMRADLGAETKIILLARHPVRRFISSFKLLKMYDNPEYDTQQFAQDLDRTIRDRPNWMRQQDQLNDYAAALNNFRRHFAHVLFLSYDELVTQPERTRARLTDFLQLDVDQAGMARILQNKINEIGETGEVATETLHTLQQRYARSIAFLSEQFGPTGCVL